MRSFRKCEEIMIFLDYLHQQKYYKPIGIDLSGNEMRVLLNKLILQEN